MKNNDGTDVWLLAKNRSKNRKPSGTYVIKKMLIKAIAK